MNLRPHRCPRSVVANLSALLTICLTAQAQTHTEPLEHPLSGVFAHQAWSTETGLPQNSVHQILQTRDGYLWIATEGGVARFNGIQFTVFTHENNAALTSNDTCCLTEDRTGALWIGTADGLVRYAEGAFHRYATADGLPSSIVLALAPTDDGSVAALTSEGLAKFDGHSFVSLNLSPSALGSGPDASLWLATATGAFSYSGGHLKAIPLTNFPTEPIEGLGSLKDGSPWLRTRNALFLWNRGLRVWHTGRELPGTRVQSFLEDSRGNLWVGTDQGLVRLPSAPTSVKMPLEIEPLLGVDLHSHALRGP